MEINRIYNNLSDTNKPDYNETVLCLLNNGQQVTLALDEVDNEWVFYDGKKLEDAYVIAWKELESKEEIMALLEKKKRKEC